MICRLFLHSFPECSPQKRMVHISLQVRAPLCLLFEIYKLRPQSVQKIWKHHSRGDRGWARSAAYPCFQEA